MNSIIVLQEIEDSFIQDPITINDYLMKRDIFSVENSTNSDNASGKGTKIKLNISYPKPKLLSYQKNNKRPSRRVLLDYDKILEILNAKSVPKKKKIVKIQDFSGYDHNLLNKKTKRSAQMNHYENKETCTEKGKKIKSLNNNLYSLDNFFSSTMKIVEKKEFIHVECPKYKEIIDLMHTDFDLDIDDSLIELCNNENITDQEYLRLHMPYEDKERELRIKYCTAPYDKRKNNKLNQKKIKSIVKSR